MIDDANDLPDGTALSADICIVGGGAAGIAMALALQGSGLRTVLLESGGDTAAPDTQALYAGTVADARLHSPPDRYRMRRWGGSTTVWGGRCMPFDPIDFERRAAVENSGWPIDHGDVLPFYEEAGKLCETGEFAYEARAAFPHGMAPLVRGFDSERFSTEGLERFSCPTDFGWRYRERLAAAADVRVVLHANLTAIALADADARQVDHVVFRTLGGRSGRMRARRYVIAAGGLETVRLLLNSPGASGRGVGNAHDVVGRYYMCHLAGTIGTLQMAPGVKVRHSYSRSADGVYCRRRFALTPETQRSEGLLNMVARLHHPRITDPRHCTGILSLLCLARFMVPYEYGKRLYGDQPDSWALRLAHLRNVLTDVPGVVKFLWHWLRDRTLAERKFPSIVVPSRANRYSLDFHAEQTPLRDSRVGLSDERDALGMRRLRVDWRYAPADVAMVRRTLALLAEDIAASGVGRFDYEPAEVEQEMVRYGAYGGHHIGTARMGTDPRTSVVDADCRVHETDNLYLAGSAVFPTSSQANPTLTAVALALRLARHLRDGMEAGSTGSKEESSHG